MPASAPLRGFYRIKPGVVMPGRTRASRRETGRTPQCGCCAYAFGDKVAADEGTQTV